MNKMNGVNKMDMTQYAESEYLTAEKIEQSETKIGVVVSDSEIVDSKFGKTPEFHIEIDGLKKKWKPNKTSIQHLIDAFGKDSKSWLGKIISFDIVTTSTGRPSIIASPKIVRQETI